MDILDLYGRALDDFVARVRAVGGAQWAAPTPCADWDVRQLVNHVVYEDRWTVPLFAGQTIADVGDRFEGDLLGADPVTSAADAAAGARAAVAAPGALDRTVQLSFGPTPATEYAMQLFADHVVHGWDLAVAIGADPALDPECVRAVAGWFAEREDGYRAAGAIGPRADVSPGASEQDRLLAAFGRSPSWRLTAG
jgi:uncharacterized protein (TIGR03086 family)